tara:strand:+ start:226 stop:474 length:249 start_codon:yes stop_codon:yes gene_type:complete
MSEEINISWKSAFRIAIAVAIILALASLISFLVTTFTLGTISAIDENENVKNAAFTACLEKYKNHPMKDQAREVCMEEIFGK